MSALRIGISHEEFWRMTPVELKQSIEAYMWRMDQERQFLSTMTAAIVNPHTKKRIKPTDLYKPISFKKKSVLPLEERMKRFAKVARRSLQNQRKE